VLTRIFRVHSVLALLFIAVLILQPGRAQAADGHENNCTAINVNYGGGIMTIVCSSGSINMAILNGNSQAGTCPTVDIETMKILTSLALSARVSGLVMTLWWTDACANGSQTIRALNSIEVKGN
jgi:hypothetical protein